MVKRWSMEERERCEDGQGASGAAGFDDHIKVDLP